MYFHGIPRLSHARHNTSHSDLFEKSELRGRALEAWFRLPRKVIANERWNKLGQWFANAYQLRHLYQPDFKGTTSAKYSTYCVSQEEAEDCQRLFHHGSNRWTERSHQSWRPKVAAKVGPEPPPGPAWMPGTQEQGFWTMSLAMLLFRSWFSSLRHVEILGWRVWWTISKTKRLWRAFFSIWMCMYKVRLRCLNRDWKPATNRWCQWMALRKSGDLCRLCGKSQQDVGLSSEPINCCMFLYISQDQGGIFCRRRRPAPFCLFPLMKKTITCTRSHQYPFGSVNVMISLALSNKLILLDVFGGIFLGRTDGRIGGCNEGICWRCMKRAMAPSRLVKCVFRRQGP